MNTKGRPPKTEGIDVFALQSWMSLNPSRWEGVKCQALIALANRERVSTICRILNVSRESLRLWRKAVENKGPQGLTSRPRKGRPPRLTKEVQQDLKEAVLKPPSFFNYSKSIWDGKLVCRYLLEKHNIQIKIRAAQYWLNKLGFSRQRPRHKLIKADPVKQTIFKETI
ncbi:TPA: hypothetical protein DCX16_02550 [bacterium]|nr:hypothetical protein [bacterium]